MCSWFPLWEHDFFRPVFARRSFRSYDELCHGLPAGGKPVPTPHQVRGRLFRDPALKISSAAAAWMALTLVASAAPPMNQAEISTGDVWITQAPSAAPAQTAQRTPGQRPLPTGDFWPAEDAATRAAEAPAPPRDQSASREDATRP
jgi:hypothetical protein